jgi:uncharacterized protein YecT (DUF1311 family)
MRKKLIAAMLIMLVLSLGLVGCGNSSIKKSIEQAKVSIESKEYDKALLSLEMALEEESNNEEAKKLYNIVDGYQRAKKLIEENKIDEAKKLLDEVNSEYTSYAIKEDIDSLKIQVDNHYKEVEKENEYLKEAESKKAQYIEKLNSIESGLSDLDYLYESGITVQMKEAAGETYKRWDNSLNEIYSLLKVQLSNSEMDELTEKQIQWISYRDSTAKNESLAFEGGTMEGLQYADTLARLTKERCYELVNNYIK